MGKEQGKSGSSTQVSVGMTVYMVTNGKDGCRPMKGTVMGTDEGGFDVLYGKEPCARRHGSSDIGKTVYVDGRDAEWKSQEMDEERYRREREDFAEQNTRPFGKI